ncbi:MAG TPA: transcription elongation factor GreA [Gammaproteobacteria bacterium]|nr:transcription elongation factor GreA [Gammaproteobacteria bacterium]
MAKTPLTVRGAVRLRDELKRLKSEDRPRIIKAIAEARAHGDLSENAEYNAAREQQSFVEGRIQDLESKLSNAEIIDVTKINTGGKVVFGSTVMLADEENGNAVTYQIVGEDEAEIKASRVSINSPVARALIGKQQGDVVVVKTPAGERQFEIIKVRYE